MQPYGSVVAAVSCESVDVSTDGDHVVLAIGGHNVAMAGDIARSLAAILVGAANKCDPQRKCACGRPVEPWSTHCLECE